MNQTETFLHSANILVSTIGAVTANSFVPGAGALISGKLSVSALLGAGRPKTDDLDKRVSALLTTALNTPTTHLPHEADKLIPQMIESGALNPAEVMAAARNPDRICAAMLDKMTDPAHRRVEMRQAFSRVVGAIFTELLNDQEVCDQLRPAFEQALAGSLAHIQQVVEQLAAQSNDTARRLGVQEGLLIALARRYAEGNPSDFASALAGLERALEVAAEERDRLPGNVSEAVEAVLARVAALNAEGEIDAAEAMLWEELQRVEAAQLRLINKGLAQVVLTRNVGRAVALEIRKLALDGRASFEALRGVQDAWYERGRNKVLRFDLEVAIALARESAKRAVGADQRGAAANDLGIALQTLGARESGTERLTEAVAAYRAALLEYTRERAPLNWAGTQNNLGNALATLGERENGTERLTEAVAAYRAALLEYTRERAPLNWAMMQNNLGTALAALGARESGTERLAEAIEAYRAALLERKRDRVPLDWAGTQNNLGSALQTLGVRERGSERLTEAVEAYHAALLEYTHERVPLDWAITQNNLGNALTTLGMRESGAERLTEAVMAFRAALLERTRERVPLDWAMTQNNLGNALATLGERESGTERLTEAVAAYRAALLECTRDRVPLNWAETQNNLALVEMGFAAKAEGAAHVGHLRAALVQVEAALEVFDPQASAYQYQTARELRDRLLAALGGWQVGI